MPKLEYPDDETLALWGISGPQERGVRDGSSPSASVGLDENRGEREFMCNWEYRFEVARWFVGQVSTYTDDDGYLQLSRLMPQKYPEVPWLIATKVTSIVGHKWLSWDDVNQVNVFKKAKLKLLYEQAPFELKDDDDTTSELQRYVEYPAGDPEPSAERLNVPGAAFKYTADPEDELRFGGPLDGTVIPYPSVGKVVPQEVFTVRWHRLGPLETIWDASCPLYQRLFGDTEGDEVPYFGAINKATFFGRGIGTCCLLGVKPRRRKDITGTYSLDLDFIIGYKPSGWNWVWGYSMNSSDTVNGWYLVTTDGTFATADEIGDFKSIHSARNLNDLFRIGEIPPP